MKISEPVLAILALCQITGNTLFLPAEQLDRKTYDLVNKCLVSIGGKWNRSAKGHVFDSDPSDGLENLLLTGETTDMKKEFQFFPTPRHIAEIVCDMAELDGAKNILEPSAGKGDLADVIHERNENLICVELNNKMKKHLDEKPYTSMVGVDFLELNPEQEKAFDRIVMNPPFSKQQDIDHIYHAYKLLAPGGILVSVMSPSPFFRTNNKSVAFKQWLNDMGAEIIDVAPGEFKASGTMIATKIIKVVKEATP